MQFLLLINFLQSLHEQFGSSLALKAIQFFLLYNIEMENLSNYVTFPIALEQCISFLCILFLICWIYIHFLFLLIIINLNITFMSNCLILKHSTYVCEYSSIYSKLIIIYFKVWSLKFILPNCKLNRIKQNLGFSFQFKHRFFKPKLFDIVILFNWKYIFLILFEIVHWYNSCPI